ncbi:hypothetical protein [Lysobacter sp. CA199]|uniref:hypothetical protein n=1 Tax=Lysobacter sp. CA199 TaxID=3455608 RepID=UPI003F8D4696
MKDTEGSSTVIPLPTPLNVTRIRLGNIWLVAAELVRRVGHTQRSAGEAPYVLVLDSLGDVHAVQSGDPDYASSVCADGFICTLDATTPIGEVAAGLRAAIRRLGAQEIA